MYAEDLSVGSVPGVTLSQLLEEMPADLFHVVASPRDADVPVSGPSIHDPLDHVAIADGELVLAVGTDPGAAEAQETVRAAAARNASAVVFRTDDEVARQTVEAADDAGIAVLSAPSSATWSHIYGLVRNLCLAGGSSRSEYDEYGIRTGDLFGFADTVATMAQGAVTIEDMQSRVIAYSSTGEPIDEQRQIAILGRRLPKRNIRLLRAAGIFRSLWETRDVVKVGDVGIDGRMSPRLAIGVFAGDEPLGSIWVAEGETPLGEAAENALRHAARPAAIHLLKIRHAGDLSRRQRSEVLRRLFDGQLPPESLTRAVGLDPGARHAVIAVDVGPGQDVDLAVRSERILNVVGVYDQALGRRSAETVIGQTVYLLVPLSKRQSETESNALTQLCSGALKSLDFAVRVAAGGAVEGLTDVAESRRDADLVLRCLRGDVGGRTSGTLVDVAPQALFLKLADLLASERIPVPPGLSRLVALDEEKGASYTSTLHAYLQHFGNIDAAASQLQVHGNTLRYRMTRIKDALDTDLVDPDTRLAMELLLRLGVVET